MNSIIYNNISKQLLNSYLKKISDCNVLIIGDVMIDAYKWGQVTRISPEAPIPIVSITKKDYRLGGAANVAINVKSIGANPFLCSVIGKDNKADIFLNLLAQNNLSNEGIILAEERKTTVKTRIMASSQHLLRIDEEKKDRLQDDISNMLIDRVIAICETHKINLIIFEDYDKGVLNEYNITKIISYARENKILTAVDPKKDNFSYYERVDLFKPNHKEFCEGLNVNVAINDISSLTKYSKQYLSTSKNQMLLLTLSEQGILISDIKTANHFSAEIRDIADVSGAGDTVISVASLLMAVGAPIEHIALISNKAGGLVCEKSGVVPINVQELINEFD